MTALAFEAAAVVRAIGNCAAGQWRGALIHLGEVAGCRVLVFPIGGMGNVNAAVMAQLVISEWRPACLLLVGVAGGTSPRAGAMCLGDILIADQFVGYEQARITQNGAARRWEVYRPDPWLLACARSIQPSAWARGLALSRPGGPAGRTQPVVHVGPVLTGAKVLADEVTLAGLRRAWPRAIGVEMESLGVALAAYHNGPRFLMVKAVSDLADQEKNDVWREYAADAAACFAIAVIVATAAGPAPGAGLPRYPAPWYLPRRLAPVVVSAVFADAVLTLVHVGPPQLAAFRPWAWIAAGLALVMGQLAAARPRTRRGTVPPPAAEREDAVPPQRPPRTRPPAQAHRDVTAERATPAGRGRDHSSRLGGQPAWLAGRPATTSGALGVSALYLARAGNLAWAAAIRWLRAMARTLRPRRGRAGG